MKIALILPVFVAIAQLHAADSKPPLTRIEYRNISPKIKPDSFAAKPRILYIGGTTYSRLEEQPDPLLGIHGLIIVAEPDLWMVNLIPCVAQHSVDPGPTFEVHHNILDRNAPKEFSTLEFGREVEFFAVITLLRSRRSRSTVSDVTHPSSGTRTTASFFLPEQTPKSLFTSTCFVTTNLTFPSVT